MKRLSREVAVARKFEENLPTPFIVLLKFSPEIHEHGSAINTSAHFNAPCHP